MPADPQVQNALSLEVQGVQTLFDVIFTLKKIRARIESLGVPQMSDETVAESAVGELSHLTGGKVKRLLAAMDVLDAALLTSVDLAGVTIPPVKALVDVIR